MARTNFGLLNRLEKTTINTPLMWTQLIVDSNNTTHNRLTNEYQVTKWKY